MIKGNIMLDRTTEDEILFRYLKNSIRRIYGLSMPEDEDAFAAAVEDDAIAFADRSGFQHLKLESITKKADTNSRWWWNHVFHKPAGRKTGEAAYPFFPQDRRIALSIIDNLFHYDNLFLDTETTGLSDESRIIEIGITDSNNKIIFSSLINPGIHIPEETSRLNGITDDMVKNSPSFQEISSLLHEILDKRFFLAWNAEFDAEAIRHEFRLMGIREPEMYYADAMRYASFGYGRGKERWALTEAAETLGYIPDNSHRAVDDSITVSMVLAYVKIIGRNEALLNFGLTREADDVLRIVRKHPFSISNGQIDWLLADDYEGNEIRKAKDWISLHLKPSETSFIELEESYLLYEDDNVIELHEDELLGCNAFLDILISLGYELIDSENILHCKIKAQYEK